MKSIHCDVVYDRIQEQFSYSHGSNRHLEHRGRPPRFKPDGDPESVYAYCRLKDGEEQFEVLNWDEVIAIRDRSFAYRNALEAKQEAERNNRRLPPTWYEAPWVRDAAEMGKKTACRRLIKWLPKSPDSALATAASIEDAQERGTLDFGSVIDGTAVPLDGTIPYAEPPPEPPPDPAGAFGDRRPQEAAPPPPPPPKPASAFASVLINGAGEAGVEVFTSAVSWARAFANLLENSDFMLETAILEHNADTIAEARQNPEAARILDDLEIDTRTAPLTIQPPQERGLTMWMEYVKRLKDAIPGVPDAEWPDWVSAQHDVLTTVPMAHRALAIRAITEACAARNLHAPPWLGALMAPADDPDKTWVDMRIADVGKINDRATFERFLSGQDVSATMVRLKTERPELFSRADMAFTAKHHELPDA
jgi:hypothetical protein